MRWLALVFVLAACKDSPRESTYSLENYVRDGVPATDHVWTTAEHTQAVKALGKIVDGHPERLPRKDQQPSRAVFDRMIEIGPDDEALSEIDLAEAHLTRLTTAGTAATLYGPASTESIDLHVVAVREVARLSRLLVPNTSDPNGPPRLDASERMKGTWGTVLVAGLMTVKSERIAVSDRMHLLGALEEELPTLLPLLVADELDRVRDLATTLAGSSEGRVREAAARIAKLVSSPN